MAVEQFTYLEEQWSRFTEARYERFVMSVDLGQSQDFTAISVLHHTRTPLDATFDVNHDTSTIRQRVDEFFDLRYLERLPLGMSYVDQVERVRGLLASPLLRHEDVDLAIDQSGVGASVGDIFEAHGLRPQRIVITAGFEPTKHGPRKWGVPKATIVSALDARFHTGELRISPELKTKEALYEELQNFQRHITAAGRSTFEARVGKHDDLVMSVGCGLWWCIQARKQGRITCGSVRGLY